MAALVGDYDDTDPISPHQGRSEDDTPFVDDQNEIQPQPEQHNEPQTENEQRLSRIETNTSTNSRPREATELDEIRRLSTEESTSEASLSSGEYRVTSRHSGATTSSAYRQERQNRKKGTKWVFESVRRFWARNVTLEVAHKGNRDYFGTSTSTSQDGLHWFLADEVWNGKHSREHS